MATPNVNPNMEYRRLGNTGLKVSVLSFGSWVTFDTQLDNNLALDCMAAAGDAGCNFFDNAEAYAGGKSETIMGQVLRELDWPRWSYVVTTKVFWGLNRETPEHEQHAQPQVPDACHRWFARAVRARLRRRAVLPPLRPEHADRGDGVGDERHHLRRQGAVLGHQRMVGRRDPRRHRRRRPAPPAPARDRAEPVQHPRTQEGREGVRPDQRRVQLRQHDLEPARVRPAHRQVQRRHPGGFACGARGLRLACRSAHRRRGDRPGREAPPDRRAARLHHGAARAGVVHEEPARVDRDHRSSRRSARSNRTSVRST